MASLCLSCKLCCTDGLFGRATVRPEEADRIRRHRLPLAPCDEGWEILFPCPAHDGRCSIYEDRPRACREYECRILAAVNAGQMAEPEARAFLARTNAAVRALRARVPGTDSLWPDVDRFCVDSPEWRRAHADLLLDVFEVRALLRKVDPEHG